jgi:hypothetical protein
VIKEIMEFCEQRNKGTPLRLKAERDRQSNRGIKNFE